jgi:hypothetical protein
MSSAGLLSADDSNTVTVIDGASNSTTTVSVGTAAEDRLAGLGHSESPYDDSKDQNSGAGTVRMRTFCFAGNTR